MIKTCKTKHLECGYVLEDVRIDGETYPKIEILPEGMFVYADIGMKPQMAYNALSSIPSTFEIVIYIPEKGLYSSRMRVRESVAEEDLAEKITELKTACSRLFDKEQVIDAYHAIRKADAVSRGYDYSAETGLMVKRRKGFVSVSKKDFDKVFYFTLLGGFLGLGRFYAGKTISALLYFFTAGLFSVGWFFDLALLFTGHFKDGYGNLVLADKAVERKLILLPFVTFWACLVLAIYVTGIHRILLLF